MNDPVIIDGFKCYSPELAKENDGFPVEMFGYLADKESRNFWYTSRNRIVKHLVKKYTGNSKKKFLEIGCGTGFVLTGLKEVGNLELSGSEIHVAGLRFAKQRLADVDLIQMDATKMPFKNEFDAMGAFDVIEHITDDELVLKNMYDSIKPGGFVYVSVPQYMFMWSYLDDIDFHKRRYSRKELVEKMERAGFKVEYVTGFVCTLFPLMYISRKLNKKSSSDKIVNAGMDTGTFANAVLSFFMRIDEFFIRLGFSLPWGGSLIAVGKK